MAVIGTVSYIAENDSTVCSVGVTSSATIILDRAGAIIHDRFSDAIVARTVAYIEGYVYPHCPPTDTADTTVVSSATNPIRGWTAYTEANVTGTRIGDVDVDGSTDSAENDCTVVSTGVVLIVGDTEYTEDDDTTSSDVDVLVSGDTEYTEDDDITSSDVDVLVSGYTDVTEDDCTVVSTGVILIVGDTDVTVGDDTTSSDVDVKIEGWFSNARVRGSQYLWFLPTTNVATDIIPDDDVISSTALVMVDGSVDYTENDCTVVSTGVLPIDGETIYRFDYNDTLVSAGAVDIVGNVDYTNEDDTTAPATVGDVENPIELVRSPGIVIKADTLQLRSVFRASISTGKVIKTNVSQSRTKKTRRSY